ncbi:MAG: methyltransferase domain-containing protein [Deltaproteobacteria bacterium]|jgi:SAM-dependent methyltransferase|nr:methyltransferase domain-containing protein [Deltaproteobacteria bacterium]
MGVAIPILPTNPYENPDLLAAFPEGLRPGGLALTRTALTICQFAPNSFLLDIGCGTGVTLEFLRKEGHRVLGVDKSARLVELASLKGPAQPGSLDNLPVAARAADGLFCECVLSLAGDKALVLAEFRRVLKLGGRLVISDMFVKNLANSQPSKLEAPSFAPPLTCAAGAMAYPALGQLLAAAGFEVIHVQDCLLALKSLAASLVWRFGSLEKLAQLWPNGSLGCLNTQNLTYGLVIGQAI